MQRQHKAEYHHGIYRHYGVIFWQQCCMCKKDFRREKSYRFIGGPFCGGAGRWYYICETCSPDKETANDIAMKSLYRPVRPEPPKRDILWYGETE